MQSERAPYTNAGNVHFYVHVGMEKDLHRFYDIFMRHIVVFISLFVSLS